jgi:iduronate 2-sulfatase
MKLLKSVAAFSGIAALFLTEGAEAQQKNILFIAVDDLRPELGYYGKEEIKSPNIDNFAKTAIVFNRAYCQMAISMASRASLLTGYLPEKYGIFRCGPVEEAYPNAVTLNKFFENKW